MNRAGEPTAEDREFLASYDPADWPGPSLAVDLALVTVHEGELAALLVRRVEAPQRGRLALPGGFVGMDEGLDDAARRVLAGKAGLDPDSVFLEQLYTFGAPGRDPRKRVVSVAYLALVDHARLARALEASDGDGGRVLARLSVPWDGMEGSPVEVRSAEHAGREEPLAFDHGEILGVVVQRLRGKLDYAALGFQLLPERFALRDLQAVHEAVLGRPLNKDSFRRRMLASGLLEPTGELERDVLHRPAELYRIKARSAV